MIAAVVLLQVPVRPSVTLTAEPARRRSGCVPGAAGGGVPALHRHRRGRTGPRRGPQVPGANRVVTKYPMLHEHAPVWPRSQHSPYKLETAHYSLAVEVPTNALDAQDLDETCLCFVTPLPNSLRAMEECMLMPGLPAAQDFLRGPPQHGGDWAADFEQQQDGQQRWLPHPAATGPGAWHAPFQPPAWQDGRHVGMHSQQRLDGASTSAAGWGDEVRGRRPLQSSD